MDKEFKTTIPDSLLAKLYDRTGSFDGKNKGFVLYFVDDTGIPQAVHHFGDMANRLTLMKTIETVPVGELGSEEGEE